MPGDSEHPVTVAQLCVSEHLIIGDAVGWVVTKDGETEGYGFRPATVADLVSALRAEGVLVIQKVNGDWPDWLTDVDGPIWHQCGQTWGLLDDIFDALAEAQLFPPAGGVS